MTAPRDPAVHDASASSVAQPPLAGPGSLLLLSARTRFTVAAVLAGLLWAGYFLAVGESTVR